MYDVTVNLKPDQIVLSTDDFTFWISVIQIVILLISASIVIYQIYTNNKWERKKATLDVNFNLMNHYLWDGSYKDDFGFDIYSTELDYDGTLATIPDELKKSFITFFDIKFNMLDTVAANIKSKVLDEDIMYEDLCYYFDYYYRWGRLYVERMQEQDPKIWEFFVEYAKRWQARLEND